MTTRPRIDSRGVRLALVLTLGAIAGAGAGHPRVREGEKLLAALSR